MHWITGVAAGALVSFSLVPAAAQDANPTVVIKDHVFHPAEIHVAAGTVVVLTVDNQDPTPEEFESSELRVEKIIPGQLSAPVRFGPLEPGVYPFFGEFNKATAQGKVIAE
jgi:plastocyanin